MATDQQNESSQQSNSQSEDLHPSKIILSNKMDENELKAAQDEIGKWYDEVHKDVCALLEKKGIRTFVLGFRHDGTKGILLVGVGHKYEVARCAANIASKLRKQVLKDLDFDNTFNQEERET